jgi:hypothetical protein
VSLDSVLIGAVGIGEAAGDGRVGIVVQAGPQPDAPNLKHVGNIWSIIERVGKLTSLAHPLLGACSLMTLGACSLMTVEKQVAIRAA